MFACFSLIFCVHVLSDKHCQNIQRIEVTHCVKTPAKKNTYYRISCRGFSTAFCVVSASSSEECLFSAIYTFSSSVLPDTLNTALPDTLNTAQLSRVHGLVSINCKLTLSAVFLQCIIVQTITCSLLLQMSVCLLVTAVSPTKNWMNRSRCHVGCGLMLFQGTMYYTWAEIPQGKKLFLGHLPAHCKL